MDLCKDTTSPIKGLHIMTPYWAWWCSRTKYGVSRLPQHYAPCAMLSKIFNRGLITISLFLPGTKMRQDLWVSPKLSQQDQIVSFFFNVEWSQMMHLWHFFSLKFSFKFKEIQENAHKCFICNFKAHSHSIYNIGYTSSMQHEHPVEICNP